MVVKHQQRNNPSTSYNASKYDVCCVSTPNNTNTPKNNNYKSNTPNKDKINTPNSNNYNSNTPNNNNYNNDNNKSLNNNSNKIILQLFPRKFLSFSKIEFFYAEKGRPISFPDCFLLESNLKIDRLRSNSSNCNFRSADESINFTQ